MNNCTADYREATSEELKEYSSAEKLKYGCFFTSIVVECKLFLPWALKKCVFSKIYIPNYLPFKNLKCVRHGQS